ncbi:MAG: hypothetical protein H6672_20310 [Anaerolineaceae bacterium]|nr:hypothetical protein [Anaerolineaceae bacterium]
MGVRLDWEIEAEQTQVRNTGEDPAAARRRRRARIRLIIFVLIVLVIIGAVVGGIRLRLDMIDDQIEQALRNTVEAEVTALRLGDWQAFSEAQRSASGDWLRRQEQTFNAYQDLKLQEQVQLTGTIRDITIDKTRARVAVEEIIAGVPYIQIWFYWRYDDGWRHVPPDYTFWGDVATREGTYVTVRYREVDAPLTTQLSSQLERWVETGCAVLGCVTPPHLTVDVLPTEGLTVSWGASNPWLLQFPSPYVTRARADMPFDTALQLQTATLLAERLVATASNNMQPTYPADADYLRQAAISWLVGQFIQYNTNAFLMDSLAQNYGSAAVGQLIRTMQPNSDVRILSTVTGSGALNQLNLDWRDYLTWRVLLEDQLIRQRDQDNFVRLYDTRDEQVVNLMATRFNTLPTEQNKTVVSVVAETGADGSPQLRAVMQVGDGPETILAEVLFRLVDGVWLRAN